MWDMIPIEIWIVIIGAVGTGASFLAKKLWNHGNSLALMMQKFEHHEEDHKQQKEDNDREVKRSKKVDADIYNKIGKIEERISKIEGKIDIIVDKLT